MAKTASGAQPLQFAAPLPHRRHVSRHRFFLAELSQALFDFVIQLLPTPEEMAIKEDVRKLLERLIRTIEPDSRLLSFGSTANGFSLRNSDMDLCCLIDSAERLSASELVTMLGDLLERETKFHVKPLPHARIPIVKLSLDPSPGLPSGIACDIGFENRLALENTRLLMCYALIDPTRVRTLVLFLKVWSKRRKINSPYEGTLSSYGYVLLVIYFLVHVKNPPVLPNLQQMPPLRPISQEDTHVAGYNTWFFDDIDLLRQHWQSSNMETVAELLIDFFRYYARDFSYNTSVASIRTGLLKKENKGWQSDSLSGRYDARERNRFCIEDPFESDFNVARCVTKDGLYLIRGEFMRASRLLATRPRAVVALAQLCEERSDDERSVPPFFVPPRLSIPPQTPYSVGSMSMRPNGIKVPERLSSQSDFSESRCRSLDEGNVTSRLPLEHMAPKRTKWTSPPPPEAPPAHHVLFENQLGQSLALATSSTGARQGDQQYQFSSEFSDDGHSSDATESDDVRSVHSYTEGSHPSASFRRSPLVYQQTPAIRANFSSGLFGQEVGPNERGRMSSRLAENRSAELSMKPTTKVQVAVTRVSHIAESTRRSMSGPPVEKSHRFSWPSSTSVMHPAVLENPSSHIVGVVNAPLANRNNTAGDQAVFSAKPHQTAWYTPFSASLYHLQTTVQGLSLSSPTENISSTAHFSDPVSPSSYTYHSHTQSTSTVTPSSGEARSPSRGRAAGEIQSSPPSPASISASNAHSHGSSGMIGLSSPLAYDFIESDPSTTRYPHDAPSPLLPVVNQASRTIPPSYQMSKMITASVLNAQSPSVYPPTGANTAGGSEDVPFEGR